MSSEQPGENETNEMEPLQTEEGAVAPGIFVPPAASSRGDDDEEEKKKSSNPSDNLKPGAFSVSEGAVDDTVDAAPTPPEGAVDDVATPPAVALTATATANSRGDTEKKTRRTAPSLGLAPGAFSVSGEPKERPRRSKRSGGEGTNTSASVENATNTEENDQVVEEVSESHTEREGIHDVNRRGKERRYGDQATTPGASQVSGASRENRISKNGKEGLKNRSVSAPKQDNNTVPSPGNDNEQVEGNLVEAQLAEDVDVEAIIEQRLGQMVVGVAATSTDQAEGDEDDEDAIEERKSKRQCWLLSLLIVAGVVVAAVVLSRPSSENVSAATLSPTPSPSSIPSSNPSQAPTTARSARVKAILADYGPFNDQALTWIREKDDWEPEQGDPNAEYLWVERCSMADLYFSAGGDNWRINGNWLSSLPVCRWLMDAKATNSCPGPLKELVLEENELIGTIPDSIGNLIQLTFLDMDNNKGLTGSIPSSIGNLSLLTSLDLDTNQLSSSIPDSIGNLSQLTRLDLDNNRLTGSIPASIGNMIKMRYLDLDDNQLTGSIPESIGNLSLLAWLDVDNNLLSSSIPPSIGNLSQLTSMDLDVNVLTGAIPSSIGNLSKLTWLDMDNNRFTSSIPSEIGKLTLLTGITFTNNQLTSTIPSSIGNLTRLTSLRMEENNFTGSIPVLPSLLRSCRLYSNCFQDITNAEAAGCDVTPNCA